MGGILEEEDIEYTTYFQVRNRAILKPDIVEYSDTAILKPDIDVVAYWLV